MGLYKTVLAVMVLLVAGCVGGPGIADPGSFHSSADSTFTIQDDRGKSITFDGPAERIVSIAASATEVVCHVGLCDRIVALDQASDFPPQVEQVQSRIYGYKFLDREGFLAARPDVVFASGINAGDFEALESQMGLRVVVLDPVDLEGVADNLRLVARIGGAAAAGEAAAATFERALEEIDERVASVQVRPRVYHEISGIGGYWTFGPGSFGNDLIARAGGINIAAGAPAASLSLATEEIVAADPEVITYSWTEKWGGSDPNEIRARPGWDNVAAVESGRIHALNSDLTERPGPRLVEGLAALVDLLHPAAPE